MKLFFTVLIALYAIPFTVFGIENAAIVGDVWYRPLTGLDNSVIDSEKKIEDLQVRDDIMLFARVKNTTKDPIVFTVAFSTPYESLDTHTASVAAYTEQSLSVRWQVPKELTMVTATITKALDIKKKPLLALMAPIGSVEVGVRVPSVEVPKLSNIKGIVGDVINFFEKYRVKELKYFTSLKYTYTKIVGTTAVTDVTTALMPDPVIPNDQNTQTKTEIKSSDTSTIRTYVMLAYATSGKALFANKAFYFAVLILLTLFVIRFILSKLL